MNGFHSTKIEWIWLKLSVWHWCSLPAKWCCQSSLPGMEADKGARQIWFYVRKYEQTSRLFWGNARCWDWNWPVRWKRPGLQARWTSGNALMADCMRSEVWCKRSRVRGYERLGSWVRRQDSHKGESSRAGDWFWSRCGRWYSWVKYCDFRFLAEVLLNFQPSIFNPGFSVVRSGLVSKHLGQRHHSWTGQDER